MRYPKNHKIEARRRLLELGGRHAKKHGFAGSGMDALASAAGVTTGSLYKHFDGKQEYFAAVVEAELHRTAERFRAIAPGDAPAAAKAIAGYLSLQHVDAPEHGCALPSLTPEVARADESIRRAYETGVREIHAVLAHLTGSRDAAWALTAQAVGAVMLARAMRDEGTRRDLLAAARRQAQALLDAASDAKNERGHTRPEAAP
ncbi:MAG TPA: TetR/AcrR family transcriptional regulator [Steroidobacteraceae bacterium]|nr:TetR/AcrR family transcriptional regulator [Steroidobacteraceae bacterium]